MAKSNKANANNKNKAYPKGNYKGNRRYRDDKTAEASVGSSRRDPMARQYDASNDASWYAKSPQLLTDSASFSFFNRLGSHITVGDNIDVRMPGVCRIGFVPTYGISKDLTSPVNISAMSMYAWVRHANSGSRNYESSDLMMYCMAVDSLYMYLAWMTRLYGAVTLYSQLNEYMPKAYLYAMDVNPSSIQANLAQFRYYINQFALKASVFCVPSDLTMYTRHAWMCSNIYLDAPGAKAQAYIFQPEGFLKYSPKTSSTGGEMKFTALRPDKHKLMTYEEITAYGDALINAILEDEDCGIISGDIKKAYGTDLHAVAGVSDAYVVVPTYNPEVLSQINNLTAVGEVETYTFKQVENVIKAECSFTAKDSGLGYFGSRILNMNAPIGTDPASVMVATRLMSAGTSTKQSNMEGTYLNTPSSCGSEVVTGLTVVYLGQDGAPVGHHPPITSFISPSSTNAETVIRNLAEISYFDWHPFIYRGTDPSWTVDYDWVFGDVQEFSIIAPHDIDRLHTAALLSMFNVPSYGSAIHNK